eukprot:scaffold51278_cov58-Phaeocystis_antarctica.AAC.5
MRLRLELGLRPIAWLGLGFECRPAPPAASEVRRGVWRCVYSEGQGGRGGKLGSANDRGTPKPDREARETARLIESRLAREHRLRLVILGGERLELLGWEL